MVGSGWWFARDGGFLGMDGLSMARTAGLGYMEGTIKEFYIYFSVGVLETSKGLWPEVSREL
jgi:hypothetical protein